MSVLSAQSIRRLCVIEEYARYNEYMATDDVIGFKPMLNPFCEETRIAINLGDDDLPLRVSHGLGSASYSISLGQDLILGPQTENYFFGLYSTIENFIMPNNVCATVHDKSTWARRGLAVQTTFIDPGWQGYLTLEISYHARNGRDIYIPSGTGIAQIVFHQLDEETELPYKGKYQNQGEKPQEAL